MTARRVIVALVVLAAVEGGAVPEARAAAPDVTSFSPASGPAGTKVSILGTGFVGATAVRFHEARAAFSVVSGRKITSTVPVAPTTSPITVATPGGTDASARTFTVAPGVRLSTAVGPPTTVIRVS